ncbi:hypothetical protein I3843_15G095800 [Carya illinoinensis]|nr:hypothetical protein I3843_15G095800 [Carya illinoinensis]
MLDFKVPEISCWDVTTFGEMTKELLHLHIGTLLCWGKSSTSLWHLMIINSSLKSIESIFVETRYGCALCVYMFMKSDMGVQRIDAFSIHNGRLGVHYVYTIS